MRIYEKCMRMRVEMTCRQGGSPIYILASLGWRAHKYICIYNVKLQQASKGTKQGPAGAEDSGAENMAAGLLFREQKCLEVKFERVQRGIRILFRRGRGS